MARTAPARTRGPLGLVLGLLRLVGRLIGGTLLLAYLLVSRSLVVVLGLYLTIYFLVGSRPFKDAIQEALADAIPGTIAAATVQLGPVPWHLRIAEGRVYGARGEEVIRVKAVEASIDWGSTLEGFFAWLDDPTTHPFTVYFDRVDLLEPWARIEVDANSLVGLERAFVLPEPEPTGPSVPPPGFDIQSRIVRVIDAGGLVETPGFRLEASGVHAVTSFSLTGEDYMAYDVPRTLVGDVRMTFTSFSHLPEPLVVDVRDLVVDDFAWRGLGFTWRRAEGQLDGGHFEGTGGLDAAPARPTWFGSGTVWLDDGAPAMETLARGAVRGPIEVSIGGLGDVYQFLGGWRLASPELRVGSLLLGDVAASGRFSPRGTAEEDQLHAIHVDAASALVAGGRVDVAGLDWEPRGVGTDASRDLQLALAATSVDLGPILAELFGLPLLPASRFSGALTLAFTERPDAQSSRLDLALAPELPPSDARSSAAPRQAVELAWVKSPVAGLPASWLLEGAVSRVRSPIPSFAGNPEPPTLPLLDELRLRGLQLDVGSNRARLAGRIDLARGQLDLEPYLRLGDVATLARELGFGEAAGRLVMKAARIGGTLDAPRAEGTINWTQARLGDRQLDQVAGRVGFADGVLVIEDLRSKSPLARFALDGRVALFDTSRPTTPNGPAGPMVATPHAGLPSPAAPADAAPGWLPSLRMPFSLEAKALEGLLASAITPVFGPDARITLDRGSFSGALLDPNGLLDSLSGAGHVVISQAVLAGEPNVHLEADLTLRPGLEVVLENARVELQSGAVWSGRFHLGPARVGDGRLRPGQPRDRPPDRAIEGRLELADTSLANLRALALAAPEISAIVRGRITIGGTLSAPSFIGTLDIDDALYGTIRLGDASLGITTRAEGPLRLVEIAAFDESFFSGFSLERAALTLDGFSPRRFEAIIRARDKQLGDFVPGARDELIELVGSATAELDLDLTSRLLSFRLRALPEELALIVRERGLRWHNATELLLVNDAGRFVLHPVTLRPAQERSPDGPRLEACGRLDPRRLDLQLAGTLELGLVPGLGDLFSVSQGRFTIAPDEAATRAIGDDTCLQNASAVLHLGGRLEAPVAVGRVDTHGLVLVPRGTGREVRIHDGASLLLRQTEGRQRVELGTENTRFEGDLDDGSFGLTGRVDFVAFHPSALDVRLVGADLFVQSPGEYAVTVSPVARIVASELDTPAPAVQISGDMVLSEGRFSKSFDTFARAVGGALGVREDTYSTSLLDELPWLGQTRLDLNVVASDFQIQAALPLARTDLPARLDLTLRGTLAEPRIFRRIDLLPGGTLAYFVFERTFTVTQGAIDFDGDPEHPLVEVTAQTPITYLQRAQTALQEEDEKEVTITLRMSGRVPDLKIELSSDDGTLDQADIQSLLITGKPRGDLDRAQESRLVSADLANVINTVLSAPFVRRASVGFDQKGGLEYRVGTCFAPNLCFDTTTISDDTETTLRAKFSLSIGDDVVCEGTLRRSDAAATSTQETYEARCRYRIPLE